MLSYRMYLASTLQRTNDEFIHEPNNVGIVTGDLPTVEWILILSPLISGIQALINQF